MFGLSRKNAPLLGIDISSTAVKLIELSRSSSSKASQYRVEHYAIEPLPANAVAEKKITEPEAVGQCIRKAVSKAGTRAKRAAVAVAGSAVITKVITMPAALSDAEIETQIQLEADQYIPYPLEEVNLDFNIIGPSKSSPEVVDVLLAASRRENVDDRISVLELAGLSAAIVDVEAYAMENACSLLQGTHEQGSPSKTLAVVDVGAATTTLHVLNGGQIIYTREQNFGGQQLREEVQRRYGLSREQAIQKILDGDVAETYEIDVLGPFKEALAQQIGRALQFFYSGTTFNKVDQILLAGGPASIARIDALVEDRLKVPTMVAQPFSQMSIAPDIKSQQLMREAPGMMVAVGLALRGLD
ncbi:pilus assembly protein PilM [Thiorhodococcus mannitoliphagus]|uniref:Pilus assembly protein PilM n=1 Tax=Thiorhodococcus mannitoliphagus TaxID=329406 RepID=A0A6P1DSP6_9GAMM|nr:pilus assembly protein PilM [Thiorhodococcus mannitoliphagus]NEX18724.1 pilus assembly protein PilM [Thiorhodococcus mannitoliphagus]